MNSEKFKFFLLLFLLLQLNQFVFYAHCYTNADNFCKTPHIIHCRQFMIIYIHHLILVYKDIVIEFVIILLRTLLTSRENKKIEPNGKTINKFIFIALKQIKKTNKQTKNNVIFYTHTPPSYINIKK